ncbi:hypothetical protein PHYBLDRAFT_166646 [Phycomyces blakesleeanus NRRL 1555(-)]|uniref:Uncharacterized protein n=1 Tax=Phycomyces blakesleeanus (strain ATCC 8743b / DSM 1359 / FGSC 10004 / NBRC 33097 / NRRL 1555) TaxID=763407 RepID=A0A167N9D3_PHYB8|nr:hypothetical protein PHYBLDRAFT_166646 [Phycomyces blakesleeanus NRRL 1555(-)]OAD75400.1 hypothetical protein PHYBLDRAFT_166646 [Phycomyces blakesleeanus NRRL 1555(-)]|eukprot:XP_018293440.1 hypothetical protein PHYBLDRAFT_166646 [Phycomyces blakesleeanus NRRL 1555(-)]
MIQTFIDDVKCNTKASNSEEKVSNRSSDIPFIQKRLMQILIGVVVAFWLGYLTSSWGLLDHLIHQTQFLYIIGALSTAYFIIFILLERIAESEAQQVSEIIGSTSALQ